MINIGTIYKITNPSGKVYIGQTTNLKERIRGHKYNRKRAKLSNSIRSYGWDKHSVEILYQGPIKDLGLDQLEIHYIRIYNSFKGGLNLTEGGGGKRGFTPSEETKAKLRAFNTGKTMSEESRMKMSESKQGLGIEWKETLRKPKKERTSDHQDKLKGNASGRRGGGRKRFTQVGMYTLEGVLVRTFPSISKAGKEIGIYNTTLLGALAKGHPVKDHLWRYI